MAKRNPLNDSSKRLKAGLLSTLLALSLCGCGKVTSSNTGVSTSDPKGPVSALENEVAPPPPADPVLVAEGLLTQTRARLESLSRDPEFNGYADFVQLARKKDGLLNSRPPKQGSLAPALIQAFQGDQARPPLSPLGRDLQLVIKAINKPALSAPVDYAADGTLVISKETEFLKIVTALNLLAESQGSSLKPELRLEASFFLLKTARHIANGATTPEHYIAGLKLENTSLALLRGMLGSIPFDQGSLRDMIAGVQSRPSNSLECLGVIDIQYLRDVSLLATEKLEAQARTQRAGELASAYLQSREQVLQSQTSPQGNSPSDGPSASSPPQRVIELEMVKETTTFKSAVELLAALEVYKLVNGSYPKALSQLVPSVLTRVPPDLLDPSGQFTYRLDGQKVSLSSALTGSNPRRW